MEVMLIQRLWDMKDRTSLYPLLGKTLENLILNYHIGLLLLAQLQQDNKIAYQVIEFFFWSFSPESKLVSSIKVLLIGIFVNTTFEFWHVQDVC